MSDRFPAVLVSESGKFNQGKNGIIVFFKVLSIASFPSQMLATIQTLRVIMQNLS